MLRARGVSRAAVAGHDRGALALHRSARLRPGRVLLAGGDRSGHERIDGGARRLGLATVTANGIEIAKAPEGVRFEPLAEGHERLYTLVGWDEKFAAHNAALWQHGLLVVVPRGVVLEKPLYVRISVTGQTFWRLVVVAEEGARASLIEEYTSPDDAAEGYSNAVTELFVSRARSSSTSPCRTSRSRPGTSPRTTRGSSGTRSSTGSPAGSGRRRARRASRTTSPDAARHRASRARTSPTAPSTSTTTRSRSTSRPTARPTSPSRARSATRRRRCGAG